MPDIKLGQQVLSNAVIEGHVGQTSFGRGRAYANKSLVKSIELDTASGKISGTVKGSTGRPYKTTLRLEERPGKTEWSIASSNCSCPVGYACKHVAALALVGRGQLYVAGLPEAQVVRATAQKPPKSTWEKELGLLYDTPAATDTTPLGLLFELVKVDEYNRIIASYMDKFVDKKARIKLAIRPMVFSRITGKWVLNELSWKNTRYSDHRFGETHLSFLRELWMLSMTEVYGYYGTDRYVFLDDFTSPQVHTLLAYGQEQAGIAYLQGSRERQPLVLSSEPASAKLTVDKTPHGGLELSHHIMVGEQVIPKERVGFIGKPARLVYIWDGDVIRYRTSPILLVPLEKPVDTKIVETIQNAKTTTVPKAEIPRFMTNQYPKLARQTQLFASPELDLLLPELPAPKMRLRLQYHKKKGLQLLWDWEYRVDTKVFELPLHDDDGNEPPAVARHDALERDIFGQVESLLDTTISAYWDESNYGEVRLSATATLLGIDQVRFMQATLPELKKLADLVIDTPDNLPDFAEFTDRPTIELGLGQQNSSTTDWFDLSVTVKLGEEEVPFELLFTALADDEDYLVLASGSYFRLDYPELDRLRSLIEEARGLQDKPSDSLRLSPFQASLWDELQALGVVTQQAETWESSAKGLLDVQFIPKVAVPKTLKARLRDYQIDGYQWLCFLWQHKLGGILADDMGLGKTLQAIALILRIKSQTTAKNQHPVLIVAPTSVSANWVSELDKFAPSLKVFYARKKFASSAEATKITKKTDVVISTYGLFRLNFDQYQACRWSVLILDEAQFIKNHQSKAYQCARKLDVPLKLALSGTPLENNLMELWSLLSVAAPGLFPSPKRFVDSYQRPIEKEANKDVLSRLRRRVRPLMLRRTKEQVLLELPPKIEQTLELELNAEHQKVYDTYLQRERQRVLGMLGDMDKNRFLIFKSLTTLRLLSLAPSLVDNKYAHLPSTKLSGLFEQLEPTLAEGHRSLIFSQFTKFLALVRQELDRRKIPYLYLDGSTKNRAELLKKFKSSDVPIFLISLKAGGFGLNLTEADYCFLLDPWWNPAVEQQAVDRAHRIGQTKQVIVYRLVAKGTIEEKVMALKSKKAKLFKNIMDDDAMFANTITTADIRALFEE